MKQFSIRQAYSRAFSLAIDNFGTLFLASMAVFLCFLFFMLLFLGICPLFGMENVQTRLLLLSQPMLNIFWLFGTIGLERIGFDLIYRGSSDWRKIFSFLDIVGSFVLAFFLYGLIFFGGLLLLVIPGLVWAVKYNFYDLFIVDTQCSATESITRSGQLTDGCKPKLFLFGLTIWLMNILSLGLLYPVTILARISVYRQLQR